MHFNNAVKEGFDECLTPLVWLFLIEARQIDPKVIQTVNKTICARPKTQQVRLWVSRLAE